MQQHNNQPNSQGAALPTFDLFDDYLQGNQDIFRSSGNLNG